MFSHKVYNLTKKIPKGKITTYKIISEKLNTKAYRSVGTILSKNKDDLVPCHRVVNQNGFVGKFSKNGDIKTKVKLLEKEGISFENTFYIKDFEKHLHKF